MRGLQIKVDGQWLKLPEDFSIDIERTSPVFNDQGAFSFPFEIPLEPNRGVFRNVADPFGYISLEDVDRMPAQIWFDGSMLYSGVIEVDEEVELNDAISVTFLSGNSDFRSRIEGMKATDIPLDRDVRLGYVVRYARADRLSDSPRYSQVWLPGYVMMNYEEFNVSEPYPLRTFCNVRICTSNESGYYKVLEAKRPYSGVCFYVLYFLECLFKHLKITASMDTLLKVEDMARLAFFTTQCHTENRGYVTVPLSEIRDESFCGPDFELKFHKNADGRSEEMDVSTEEFVFWAQEVFATSENFPDVEIAQILDDLQNAFGIRLVYDDRSNRMDMFFLKDMFADTSSVDLGAQVLDYTLSRTKVTPSRITYGVDDNESFNYSDYSNAKTYSGYQDILDEGVYDYDTTCKVDLLTGNAYRVRVNRETGSQAALFEVGGYRDYVFGGEENSDSETSDIRINFSPVIVNLVDVQKAADGTIVSGGTTSRPSVVTSTERSIAVFADVELKANGKFDQNIVEVYLGQERPGEQNYVWYYFHLKALCPELYDTAQYEEPPLRSYDAGYCMGIMRGPGSKSGVETVAPDYDGEGNDSWVQTVADYAFSSDSCDNYGKFFDYNGTEEGGAEQDGRFSLKLVAGKDGYEVDGKYAYRGLVSKFLYEYLYFMNRKKTVQLTVDLSVMQIVAIDFRKRYRIGGFTGFVNRISYTLTASGVSRSVVELYIL